MSNDQQDKPNTLSDKFVTPDTKSIIIRRKKKARQEKNKPAKPKKQQEK